MVDPSVWSAPASVGSRAGEAFEVAERCGLVLDDWQRYVLERALGVRDDGQWAAFELGLVVSRQNGKGAILEALELGGLFAFGERLIIHSAHQFDTSMEAFLRMEQLLEEGDLMGELRDRSGISRSHGSEGFVLRDGRRLRYRTRTKGGGRGYSGDRVIFDEAMALPEATVGALLSTMSARPNPQLVYTGSAVDQMVFEHGTVLARVRERGRKGDPSLAYFEWSGDPDVLPGSPEAEALIDDVGAWRRANPALGIRITEEFVQNERRALDPRTFLVERLAIGDWPDTDPLGAAVIPLTAWDALADTEQPMLDPVRFAYDVSPDRSSSAVAAAGLRPDGLATVEIIEHKGGTGWVADYVAARTSQHRNLGVWCDAASPAASLIPELLDRGVRVKTTDARELASACGMLFDKTEQEAFRHRADPRLRAAIRSAAKRDLGDAWAWARKKSSADISPLVAATIALWATWTGRKPSVYDRRAAAAAA